jgi:hypothetical protein
MACADAMIAATTTSRPRTGCKLGIDGRVAELSIYTLAIVIH